MSEFYTLLCSNRFIHYPVYTYFCVKRVKIILELYTYNVHVQYSVTRLIL